MLLNERIAHAYLQHISWPSSTMDSGVFVGGAPPKNNMRKRNEEKEGKNNKIKKIYQN